MKDVVINGLKERKASLLYVLNVKARIGIIQKGEIMIYMASEPKTMIPETSTEERVLRLMQYALNKMTPDSESVLITGDEIKLILSQILVETSSYKMVSLKGDNVRKAKMDVIKRAVTLFPDSIIVQKGIRNKTSLVINKTPELEVTFQSIQDSLKTIKINHDEYEYPSYEDISYLFSTKIQKEKNKTLISYHDITIRRDLMLRILNKCHNDEFTLRAVKYECNDREGDENFMAHWDYLLNNNFIEKTANGKFKFCDRVRQWKYFK